MKIHADLSQNATVQTNELEWIPSPMKGVERKMIERDGEELARATSLVRYAAGSSFSAHTHDLGEEFIVLEGVFSDDSGNFPKGTYVRNPAGSKHIPQSAEGCMIFVKLRQFHLEDQSYVRINFETAQWQETKLLNYLPLHHFGSENVAMIRTNKDCELSLNQIKQSVEIFLMDGEIQDESIQHKSGTWLRFPSEQELNLSLQANSLLYIKTGHLPQVTLKEESFQWQSIIH